MILVFFKKIYQDFKRIKKELKFVQSNKNVIKRISLTPS
jgi:hypothetical protein